MGLKIWSEFLPEARLVVADCPDILIESYLRLSAIELCSRSKSLTFDMPAFDTEAGTSTYALAPSAETEMVQIIDGAIDGDPLDTVRRDELVRVSKWPAEIGTPSRFMVINGNRDVLLWPTPDAAYRVSLTLAVKPTLDATGVEEWFADMARGTIISGALAPLLALPKRAWSDPSLSVYHQGLFENGVISARAFAEKSGTRAPLRTKTYGRA